MDSYVLHSVCSCVTLNTLWIQYKIIILNFPNLVCRVSSVIEETPSGVRDGNKMSVILCTLDVLRGINKQIALEVGCTMSRGGDSGGQYAAH